MNEGQGVAPATMPWGGAGDAAVGEPAWVEAPLPTAKHRAPELAKYAEPEEPHVRVDARKLEAVLLELRAPIVRVPLLLECPGVEAARAERRQMLGQIDDYLLPRLRQSGAPILISMVGSTCAGK